MRHVSVLCFMYNKCISTYLMSYLAFIAYWKWLKGNSLFIHIDTFSQQHHILRGECSYKRRTTVAIFAVQYMEYEVPLLPRWYGVTPWIRYFDIRENDVTPQESILMVLTKIDYNDTSKNNQRKYHLMQNWLRPSWNLHHCIISLINFNHLCTGHCSGQSHSL